MSAPTPPAAMPSAPPARSDAESGAQADTPRGSAPPRVRPVVVLAATAAAFSASAYVYFARLHETLGYQDSFSHLEISRRVLAGRSPGIAQLGGVWLPLPHMLQALLAWNWTLYRTGLAGALVSMLCYVACSVLIFKIVQLLCGPRLWPAVAGVTVFMTNPDVLYQQATPMDELPFYAFTLAVIHELLRWAATRRPTCLLTAGTASLLAILCRYEAWFLAVLYVGCVVWSARRLGHGWPDVRGLALVPIVFGCAVAAGGWLLYNALMFGSPLYFLTGPDSSRQLMAQRRHDVEIGNWWLTAKAYAIAAEYELGVAVLGAGVLALAVFLVCERRSARLPPVLALTLVVPFLVYTLESGQAPMGVPQINGGLLNVRFALVVVLPCAILIGYLVGMLPRRFTSWAAALSTAALAVMAAATLHFHGVVLADEADADNLAQTVQAVTGDYVARHTTGTVLVNFVGNERVAFPFLDRVVYEGTMGRRHLRWPSFLADPRGNGVQVIVMRMTASPEAHGPDAVYTALYGSPALRQYRVAYQNAVYRIYALPGATRPSGG